MEKTFPLIVVLLMGVLSIRPAKAGITDVYIQPPQPTIIDPITVNISGVESQGPVVITDPIFSIEQNTITLDISIDVGYLMVVTPWSHSELLGTLSPDFYDLTVNAHYCGTKTGTDTYLTSFTVVPEPCSMALLALGSLLFLRKRRI